MFIIDQVQANLDINVSVVLVAVTTEEWNIGLYVLNTCRQCPQIIYISDNILK